MTHAFALPHRSVFEVAGPDSRALLDRLVTASLPAPGGAPRHGALLTPQGKIIADMFFHPAGDDGFLVDAPSGELDALVKKLTLYRLRADAKIAPRPDLAVAGFAATPDPRAEAAPGRAILQAAGLPGATAELMDAWNAARIAAGCAEGGVDYATEKAFPADVNMDLLGGVDFRKGCFVGQEVVSRMKRRGVARRRTLVLDAAPGVAAGDRVVAGDVEIGTVTSVAGGLALAVLRIDDLDAAGDAPVLAGSATANVRRPGWLAGELAALKK